MRTALITGGSAGFGLATARELGRRGWRVTITGRHPEALAAAREVIPGRATAIPGDVADQEHRARLSDAVGSALDLLVNNASELGPSPLPRLSDITADALRSIFDVNVVAPIALAGLLAQRLEDRNGIVVNLSSDAAVEAYPGWGGYGASKAALDQASAVLAAEHPDLIVYAFDPGDMRTAMHQRAFPGEDISDRPDPETVVPALMQLIEQRPASGRYSAASLLVGSK